MYDLAAMMANANVEQILTLLNVAHTHKRSVRGYEFYFKCLNPFHKDSNPSCSIAADGKYNGLYNCWSCHDSGNIYQLIKTVRGCSWMQAVEWLAKVVGAVGIDGSEALSYRLNQLKPKPPDSVVSNGEIKLRLPATYTVCGLGSPYTVVAERYLQARGISKLTSSAFACGAADHPLIGYSLLIPINMDGKLVNMFYCEPKRGGEKRYLKGISTNPILFNYDNALKTRACIIVESILDVLQMHTLGYENGISCFSNKLSKEHIKLLKKFDQITVFPDLDNQQGWKLVDQIVMYFGKSINLALPPIGKDPGDCTAIEMTVALQNLIKYASWEVDQVLRKRTFSKPVLDIKKA